MSEPLNVPHMRYIERRGKNGQVWGYYYWDGRARGFGEVSLGSDKAEAIRLRNEYEASGPPRTTKRRRDARKEVDWLSLPQRARDMYRSAVFRAESRQRECLTAQEFCAIWTRSNGRCEVSGVALADDQTSGPFTPSLDRIDAGKGYEAGNCRIVCTMVNFAMNVWGEEPLLVMARSICCGIGCGSNAEAVSGCSPIE